MSDLQKQLFDYGALDAESRIIIQQRTGEIKTLAKRLATDIVDIGGKLVEVKDRLGGNGKFTNWLLAELGWSERTAYNFIGVYEKFGTANFAIENVAPSALYLLVAPGTPEPARQAVIEMANQGEKVSHKAAKVIVEMAKEAEPKTLDMFANESEESEPQPTSLFDEEPELPEAEAASAEQSSNEQEAVLTPDKSETAQSEPAAKPKPVANPEPPKPAPANIQSYWSQKQIVIGITLMPVDNDPRGRQAIVSIREGDGPPTIQPKRIQDLPGEWPKPIDEMINAFAVKMAASVPSKTVNKSTKPAKKGARK